MRPVEQALYTRLSGDATLQALLATPTSVFNGYVPEGSLAPWVVFSLQSHVDHATLSRPSGYEQTTYLVKAITHGQGSDTSSDAAETIRSQIDTLLNDYALTVAGYSLMVCRRTAKVKYPEVFDGLVVWHVGSVYQIGVSS